MRISAIVIASLALVGAGIAIGWIGNRPETGHEGSSQPMTPLERLRAGYFEIDATVDCVGQPSGVIRIRISNLLDKLNAEKTIVRDVSVFRVGDKAGMAGLANGLAMREPVKNEINSFPTRLDFATVWVDDDGIDHPLVDPRQNPRQYVMVRVILDQAPGMNDSVAFLHPPADATDSAFAIMRQAGTDPKIFCNRRKIATETVDGGRRTYVEFGVQSVAPVGTSVPKPISGSFGIGLLVRDGATQYVTPIILDPNVRNQG
nr:hypothetical protein [Polymorphobacter sp.]